MQYASLVVAICGLVLAGLSLGWQAANFVLTGGRVKVEFRVGARAAGRCSPQSQTSVRTRTGN
ncbi:hypothetical protein [Micromonospora hortensis]|uniref:hypothetical protein n=1 Tax=Micromonospora hortensis TaxID=2911209 RepID=UPI001EE8D437|nr:hypothetical protein [Micromonospora hortensis]MCG5450972.1 hypothetical protein [Micromonospora hortensis]